MENLKLYEITNALRKLDEFSEEEGDLKEYLDGVKMQLSDKVGWITKSIRNFETRAGIIDIEIKRLAELKGKYAKEATSRKDYMSYELQKAGVNRLDTDIARLSFRKSEQVIVEDSKKIEGKYFVTTVTKRVDKMEIKKVIKAGEKVKGARIEVFKNLQIK